jgi:hypothetical protein
LHISTEKKDYRRKKGLQSWIQKIGKDNGGCTKYQALLHIENPSSCIGICHTQVHLQ